MYIYTRRNNKRSEIINTENKYTTRQIKNQTGSLKA